MARPFQIVGLAAIAGLALVGCGDGEVVDTVTDSVTEQTETIADAVDSSVDEALQAEGKTLLGAIVRGQQAYYLTADDSAFASTVEDLALGLSPETDRYSIAIVTADQSQMVTTATAKKEGYKSYSAAVFAVDGSTVSIICEADAAGTTPPAAPELTGGEVTCPAGATAVD
ncbi:MAG: type IV pilin-like G/H family protein [Cyanobacteria bacterium P01_H01_bin.162]